MTYDKEKVNGILAHLDSEEDALAYYSLEYRSGLPLRQEWTLFSLKPEEPQMNRSITFREVDGKLVSVFELGWKKQEILSMDVSMLDRWLHPDYILTREEEKYAKEKTEEYFSENKSSYNFFETFGMDFPADGETITLGNTAVSEEDYMEALNHYMVSKKISNFEAVKLGLLHALPFYDMSFENAGESWSNFNAVRA